MNTDPKASADKQEWTIEEVEHILGGLVLSAIDANKIANDLVKIGEK